MFNFEITFLNNPFSLTDIIIAIMTLGGTALATYLAAKYAGKNANDIAKNNNKFQEEQLFKSKKEDHLTSFLVTFNTLASNIEDFYGSHKESMRTTAFDPPYKPECISASPKYRGYIDEN